MIDQRPLVAVLCLLTILLPGCGGSPSGPPPNDLLRTAALESPTEVSVEVLELTGFTSTLTSLATIKSRRRRTLTAEVGGALVEWKLRVGQRVEAGEVVARQSTFEQRNKAARLENQIAQARIDIEARLLGLGYSSDGDSIPTEIAHNVELESNLPNLQLEQELLADQIKKSVIVAPITGVVASVAVQEGESLAPGQEIAVLLDDRNFEAVFPILETELAAVAPGQRVELTTYGDTLLRRATVNRIAPQVTEEGSILIYADVKRPTRGLLDGMSAKVTIRRSEGSRLVLPKSAVVDRQDRLVVFLYKDGHADWNYVTIVGENTDSYAIGEGIAVGDTVIVGNNFDLAHLEEVVIAARPVE